MNKLQILGIALYQFCERFPVNGDCVKTKGFTSNKQEVKDKCRKIAKEMETELGVKLEYSFCAGGPGVTGEAIIKGPGFEVWIGEGVKRLGVMYRKFPWKHADPNMWSPWQATLTDLPRFCNEKLRPMINHNLRV